MTRLKRYCLRILSVMQVVACLLVIWLLWGLIQYSKPLVIKDIAYDNIFSVINKFEGYTVYLKESGRYEPYLVLSQNYNKEGNVLLLRKYLLDKPRQYNKAEGHGAYYENSQIDKYLNTKFKNTLAPTVKDKLVTSQLEITALSSVGSVGDETTHIPRQVFLLSHEEMVAGSSGMATKEGKKLLYFLGFHSFIATTKVGEAEPYWLRSPYTEYENGVWGIKSSGEVGDTPLWNMFEKKLYTASVRPAFCLDKKTKLVRQEGIVKGKTVFVLKEDEK